jgi:hypothetical protein
MRTVVQDENDEVDTNRQNDYPHFDNSISNHNIANSPTNEEGD